MSGYVIAGLAADPASAESDKLPVSKPPTVKMSGYPISEVHGMNSPTIH